MKEYVLMTDSCCDLNPELLLSWGVKCVDLTIYKENDTEGCSNRDLCCSDFYAEMRNGTVYQTSAVNPNAFMEAFREVLEQGKNILCICLSSGLSTTKNSADMAARELAEEYPDQKMIIVDSLCASAGQGLLVYYAVQKKREGMGLEELEEYILKTSSGMCHWFTVDDLKYLKRGGRISATSAIAAAALDIKPVMHMDDSGHLVGVAKTIGRKRSIKALFEKFQSLASDPEREVYFISHADCMEDARFLENMIYREYGVKAGCITDVGPVIGAHSGPGTLALFFVGKQR